MRIGKLIFGILFTASAAAASTASAVEIKYELNPAATIRDILVENVSKRVALRLNSGDEIEGTVEKVGNNLVHISRLPGPGNEIYFVIVSIDKINSVRLMVRQR
jgi:hypothetical protein